MEYKYVNNCNFEDFACGRVIYHRGGIPNYPVRLSCEIFSRCMSYLNKESEVVLYDPCCGGAYTLTVLGYLFPNTISRIYASDISEDAINLAESNLSLLSTSGLMKRKAQIEHMINEFNKDSHREALRSVDRLFEIINMRKINPILNCFSLDILENHVSDKFDFVADIVFVDVPYGNLVEWSSQETNNIDIMLESLTSVIGFGGIVAVSSNKSQKINATMYTRLEKIKVGKRKIEIFKLNSI